MSEQTEVNDIIVNLLNKSSDKLDKVAETVTRVDANVATIIGPDGRLPRVESAVDKHNKALWIGLGLLAAGTLTEVGAHGGKAVEAIISLFIK